MAYLVNIYPSPSHTFIRREIRELESQGLEVWRFSVRRCPGSLVDGDDRDEALKTRYILDGGVTGLLWAALLTFLRSPAAFLRGVVRAVRIGRRSDKGVLYHLVYLCEACVLLRWCGQLGVRHVHAHFGTNSAMVPLLCHLLGGPTYSFTVHGPEEFDRPAAISLTEKIKHARFVVAITSFCKSQLFRWCPYEDWGKVHIVRCGLDTLFLDSPHQPVPDVPRLLCVGRLCEQKGQILLVEAASMLWEEGRRFEVQFVGDGAMRPDIEAAIRQRGLEDCIQLLGWASGAEVHERMQNARAVVLPSFAEGLPVVIMEGMALGRPVISTWITGVPELLEDGKSGWLIEPGSVKALAEAMHLALDTPVEELTRMGLQGAEAVRRLHDIRVEASKLAALFREG